MTFVESRIWQLGWSEETCLKMHKFAQEDHSYVAFRRERDRYDSMWALLQRSFGLETAATRDRGDHAAVVTEFRNAKNAVESSGARYTQIASFKKNAAAAKRAIATIAAAKSMFGSTGLGDLIRTMMFRGKSGGHLRTGGTDVKGGSRRSFGLSIFKGVSVMRDRRV